jgi:hypothetical protein
VAEIEAQGEPVPQPASEIVGKSGETARSNGNALDNVAGDLFLPTIVEHGRATIAVPGQILDGLQGYALGKQVSNGGYPETMGRQVSGQASVLEPALDHAADIDSGDGVAGEPAGLAVGTEEKRRVAGGGGDAGCLQVFQQKLLESRCAPGSPFAFPPWLEGMSFRTVDRARTPALRSSLATPLHQHPRGVNQGMAVVAGRLEPPRLVGCVRGSWEGSVNGPALLWPRYESRRLFVGQPSRPLAEASPRP